MIRIVTPESAVSELANRARPRKPGWLDIDSPLKDFALISYAVPVERLERHIPTDRFEIQTFEIDGERLGLLSVVPFLDDGFRFRLFPLARFHFAQTNYRVYVKDRRSGQPCVWFFGTTLGGWPVHIARFLWKIPWHPAKYAWKSDYDEPSRTYRSFRYRAHSDWADLKVHVRGTGEPAGVLPGFSSLEEQTLVLTHPVDGYFYRLDGELGTYSVSHEVLDLTRAEPVDLRFDLLERLGVLTQEEAQSPHSILLCRRTVFRIHMPPRRVR